MTIEERRANMIKFVRSRVADNQMNYKDAEVGISLLEEIFSMADSWHEMAVQMKRMADAQEETMNMHKRMIAIPLKEGNA